MGAFEEADGGTLFLDEVGDLPLGIQVKLLLKNAMEYAMATAEGAAIRPWNLPKPMRSARAASVEAGLAPEAPAPPSVSADRGRAA